jgi:simple sugar transport system permease protein
MEPFDASWLIAAVGLTTPILLAAMGELVAERAGIFNIGLEGMMLTGAFCGFIAEWKSGSVWIGFAAAVAGSLVLSALMAFLSIQMNADQVIVGVGLNILAIGLTTFAFQQIFADRAQVLLNPMDRIAIPVLSDLPWIGKAFFEQTILGYFAFLSVPLIAFVLYRTSLGLSIRAAGELPEAVTTAGMSVSMIRWVGTLTAGVFAGLGGAFLSVVSIGLFVEGMSAGRGYLALAAVIFGGWRPIGVLAACFVFGGADALQLRLQAVGTLPRPVWIVILAVPLLFLIYRLIRRRRIGVGAGATSTTVTATGVVLALLAPSMSLPSQLWLALPYVLALVVLAGFVGRPRMPAALAVPLHRHEEHD